MKTESVIFFPEKLSNQWSIVEDQATHVHIV